MVSQYGNSNSPPCSSLLCSATRPDAALLISPVNAAVVTHERRFITSFRRRHNLVGAEMTTTVV